LLETGNIDDTPLGLDSDYSAEAFSWAIKRNSRAKKNAGLQPVAA